MNVDNPHDRFFKETFSRPDILTDFLRVYLPDSVLQGLNLDSLVREADSHTDDQLTEHFADLVFSAQFGEQAIKVVLLLEHKSYTEEHPHFQLNRYLLNLWESQLKQKQPLTPILPIVVYHGKRRWKKRSMAAYFGKIPKSLTSFLPAFDYILVDLSAISQRLPEFSTDYARVTGLLLQHSRQQRQFINVLENLGDVLQRMANDAIGERFMETAFLYAYWATDLTRVDVIAIFRKISNRTGEIAMSTAERLINEGLEKGREQGLEKGVRALLKVGMDADAIAAALEMPPEQVKSILELIRKS